MSTLDTQIEEIFPTSSLMGKFGKQKIEIQKRMIKKLLYEFSEQIIESDEPLHEQERYQPLDVVARNRFRAEQRKKRNILLGKGEGK